MPVIVITLTYDMTHELSNVTISPFPFISINDPFHLCCMLDDKAYKLIVKTLTSQTHPHTLYQHYDRDQLTLLTVSCDLSPTSTLQTHPNQDT